MSIVNAERQINGPVLWIFVFVVGVITLLLIVFLFFFLLWCKRSRNNIAPIPSDLRKIVWLHNHNSSQTLPISASGATSANCYKDATSAKGRNTRTDNPRYNRTDQKPLLKVSNVYIPTPATKIPQTVSYPNEPVYEKLPGDRDE
jgi:hypothetical protein